ncbi:DUF2934 domain-containing protein [Azospirillum isscasi]|uniref:DUF2934 domain-containing protein n=1 Tax=Azospirillum isscasi TaxID=3053926 RepID=A0ABU0WGJ0_9PROT|nr:DUF2934 domain-containing protein [Azospirillum isscasi]MDQ2102739.1 DUF2934 domain-containing protein [Azospirillum isscasi]
MTKKPEHERAHRVQRRAHDIWEREGRPHGRHDEHWAQAEAEVDDEIRAEQQSAETESSAPDAPPKRRPKAASPKPAAKPKAERGSGTRAAAENLSAVAAGRTEQTGTTKTGGQISRGGAASGKPGKASRRDASRG